MENQIPVQHFYFFQHVHFLVFFLYIPKKKLLEREQKKTTNSRIMYSPPQGTEKRKQHQDITLFHLCTFVSLVTHFFFYSCTEEYHNYALNLNQGSVRLVLDLGRLLIFHVLSYFLQYKIYIWLEATGHEINGAPENSTEPRSPTLHTPRNNIHSISKSSKQPISKISTPVPESNHYGNI